MKLPDKEIFQFALQNMISEIGETNTTWYAGFSGKDFFTGVRFYSKMKSPDKEAAENDDEGYRTKFQTYSHYDFQAGIGSLVDSMKKLPVSCRRSQTGIGLQQYMAGIM